MLSLPCKLQEWEPARAWEPQGEGSVYCDWSLFVTCALLPVCSYHKHCCTNSKRERLAFRHPHKRRLGSIFFFRKAVWYNDVLINESWHDCGIELQDNSWNANHDYAAQYWNKTYGHKRVLMDDVYISESESQIRGNFSHYWPQHLFLCPCVWILLNAIVTIIDKYTNQVWVRNQIHHIQIQQNTTHTVA